LISLIHLGKYLSIWSFPELINMEILNRLIVTDMFVGKNDLLNNIFLAVYQCLVEGSE
jgi:hypothetical protein